MEISQAEIPYTILVAQREIEPGDRLAADCYDDRGNKIAARGDVVDETLKQRLKNMGVRKAWLQRHVAEWMPLPEAKLRNYDILVTRDVSPLHCQILSNIQGTFSTQGLEQLLDRIRSSVDAEDQDEALPALDDQARELIRRESRLHDQIDQLDEDLRTRYRNLLASASPQAVDPSAVEKGKAGIGRKIQSFLEDLNRVKNMIADRLLERDESELASLFDLEELGSYDSTPDFADSFVLFERMFALPSHEDTEPVTRLFEASRDLLDGMFYERSLDSDLLGEIDSLLWSDFEPELPHWFQALGEPGRLNAYLLAHSVNTALMVSQLYAASDEVPEHETRELTLACLAKDIGMVLVPQSYHLHDRDLTDEQREKLKIHPMTSRQFLQDVAPGENATGDLVEAHHEKIDGSGYPLGTQKVSRDQRLLNLCEVFDAMTSPRTWRPALSPAEALVTLREEAGRSQDKRWVDLLIREVGIYPVGTLVRLSDNQPALVVSNNPSHPDQPRVITVSSLMGTDGDATVLDLRSASVSVDSSGTTRKAPGAYRKQLLQDDQILSRVRQSSSSS